MRVLFLLLTFLVVTSCRINGLTNDFGKLTTSEKELISNFVSFENVESRKIYEINALQLRKELYKNEKSIVYIFLNGCSSELCKPLKFYEDFAKENGYSLYMIMSGYTNLRSTMKQDFSSPLFSIDNRYYKTNISFNYFKRFENHLLGRPLNGKQIEYQGNIYFFNKDKLVEIRREL